MRGVILAGGSGSRLFPLTKYMNKHLLPVGDFPMILYSIQKFRECGIKNILIVTGKENISSFVNLLGSGSEYELQITYQIQDQPGGIAQALGLAEPFVRHERSLVVLGDNLFSASLIEPLERFQLQPAGAKIFLAKVHDAERYGVAEIDGEQVVSIEEKPQKPKSNYCVTGIYMYDASVFKIIKNLKPSGRQELEITDVNNAYLKAGTLTYEILDGWWIDAGTFSSIAMAHELVRANPLKLNIVKG